MARQRSDTREDACIWRFANVEFDEMKWELRVAGVPVDVEPRPLDILQMLLRHAGEVVEKDELIEAVYGHLHIGDGALTNAIGKLRRVLGDDGQKIVVTIHRIGYRFAAPVQRIEAVSAIQEPERLIFKPGDVVPGREHWVLQRVLGSRKDSEVWLAKHAKGGGTRVYKFSQDGDGLRALKREVALYRVLRESLGEREDLVSPLDWNFEASPFFLECDYLGLNLSAWCESRGGLGAVPLAQRIEILARVAEAVAATHSVGVLHKDLKPHNVLIEDTGDGAIAVRVADFGSGRLLQQDRLRELGITQIGFTLTQSVVADSASGTLLYIAPEVLSGHSPTVQADIYALGVMLYQLVIGDFRKVPTAGWEHDIADPLLREDIAAAAEGDPQRRLGDAGELVRRLRTLDARREERAAEQAARHEAERAQKEIDFLRARRFGLHVALAVLVVGFIITGALAWRIAQAEKHATQEARRAKNVSEFLNHDLLATIGTGDVPLRNLTVKQMLESADAQVDQRFGDDPEAAATVYASLGSSFLRLDETPLAERNLDKALALFDRADGPGSAAAVSLMPTMLLVKYSLGKLDEFTVLLDQVIAAGERRLGPAHEAVLNARLEQARTQALHGGLEAARLSLRGSADALEQRDDKAMRPMELQMLRLLGVIEYGNGELKESEHHLRRALALAIDQYGINHQRVAGIQIWLASTVQHQGRSAEADALFKQAEDTFAHWEPDSGDMTLRAKTQHGDALLERDQPADAVALLQTALARWQSKPRRPVELNDLCFAQQILARAQLRNGDLAGSDATLALALAGVHSLEPPGQLDRWSMELDEAEHRLLHRDYEAARAIVNQPLPADLPATHRGRAQLARLKGLLARADGHEDESRRLLKEALDAAQASFGPEHWQTRRLVSETTTP